MTQMNTVFLRGNLTRDPEKRFLPSGSSVVNFGLAVNRRYRSGEEWKEDTCFVDIVVYGKQGDWIIEQCRKGSPLLVEGRLSYRTWESQEGQKRSKHEVVAHTIHILARRDDSGEGGGARASQGGGASRGGDDGPPMTDDDIPF